MIDQDKMRALAAELRKGSGGRYKWYAMDRDETSYFMDFDWGYDADRWFADQQRSRAAWIEQEGIHLVKKLFQTELETNAAAAADAIDLLLAEVEAAAADKQELLALLPGPYYMDPPDGGAASMIEQLRRMAKDAERYRWLRDEDAGVPDGERELCVVQFRLPFTEAPDRDLFDVALDAAIDAALAQRQGEGS